MCNGTLLFEGISYDGMNNFDALISIVTNREGERDNRGTGSISSRSLYLKNRLVIAPRTRGRGFESLFPNVCVHRFSPSMWVLGNRQGYISI